MKLNYSIEIHPAIALLLIVLAVFGCDAFWTQQRKTKRATSQPISRPGMSTRMPPSPFGGRPAPSSEPITPTGVTVERDVPTSPFGSRTRSTSATAHEKAQARIKQFNLDAKEAATNGVNAYVRQHQPQQQ